MTREAELHYVIGPRGSGKTTTMKAITAHLLRERERAKVPARLVVFDPAWGRPADEWYPRGASYVHSRADFLRGLAGAKVLVVKGVPFVDFSPLPKLRELVVVVDEAHHFMSRTEADPSFVELVSQGRHNGIDLVIGTQLPSQLHRTVVGNPDGAWVHQLVDAASREWVERSFGVSLRGVSWQRVAGTKKATYPIRFPEGAETSREAQPLTRRRNVE